MDTRQPYIASYQSFKPNTTGGIKAPFDIAKQQKIAQAGIGGIAGLTSLYAQNQAMQNQANMIQTSTPGEQIDANGKPSYNLGGFAQQTEAIDPSGASVGEIGSGALSGFSTGAAIGSVIPGIGTLIGGGIGAIGGALSSVFGGSARKSEEEKKKTLAQANLRAAQMQYNNSMMAFNNKQSGMDQYNDLQNPQQRINNLYTYNAPNV